MTFGDAVFAKYYECALYVHENKITKESLDAAISLYRDHKSA